MGTKTEINILETSSKLKVLGKLAEGGMGASYLAEQHGAAGYKKTVAVKPIRAPSTRTSCRSTRSTRATAVSSW